ncbi:zona pellucida sperm-binding protein 3-like [Clinocottus analis]|uniref:zona pellucida sperm-binding protein 3-like n=1 Tax=Clinocottus analis TaxID=304258 RepID=UPI0035C1B71F
MAIRVKYTRFVHLFVLLLSACAEKKHVDLGTRENVGLEIKCGEVEVTITVKRLFFEKNRVPFKPENLRLGAASVQQSSCGAKSPQPDSMLISAGLQECGTESSVRGEWLVYSNQLVLLRAAGPAASAGGVIVRAAAAVTVPVECHYKRKQTVNGEPLTPTWLPMTSTVSAVGLLHFSLRSMAGGCTALRSSSVYQQGEAVFLEASVEAPLHPPLALFVDRCVATLTPDPLSLPSYRFISKHGCLMDSVLPGSSSTFLSRKQENRLCFSVQAFRFNPESSEQMFISCHIRVTLKPNSPSRLQKACSFHRPTFSWRATEGDNALCACCDSDDCSGRTGEERVGLAAHTTPRDAVNNHHEADTTVGPLHTLPRSHWTGRLSVSQ